MGKKEFLIILVLSVVVTWVTKEVNGILNFSLGGLNAGSPLGYYKCEFISSCNIDYTFLVIDIAFWFMVIWIIWKIFRKISSKK